MGLTRKDAPRAQRDGNLLTVPAATRPGVSSMRSTRSVHLVPILDLDSVPK